ncbi:MAG TPA: sulfate/molybdate ABC transporter ATP-binding protein [Candidatus Acidoferrales bacterium]|nr:sulfate/molybdate ABC transporter ATP-binding protein [Candidatus Acidoferrales bacterium]
MALKIQIEKRMGNFALNVQFSCGDGPLAVLGASGAGKTMTLRCIAGLERPDRGQIILHGSILFDSSKGVDVASRKRRIGFVFQNYALFPHLTVAENVAFGLGNIADSERRVRVGKQLAQMHVEQLAERFPRDLSGGEQQRVALGRALAIEPEALLLDEPLAALDTHLRSQIEAQLIETLGQFRGPALFVTHNVEEAYRMAENFVVLSKGRVAASGPKEEIFRRPPSLEVALLTGLKNFSRARAISPSRVEAIDWNCALDVAEPLAAQAAYVGIRAHHVDFPEAAAGDAAQTNTFPCWLTRASETPFRITLYLRLHAAPGTDESAHHLQAEVFKEKWLRFKDQPQPWHVRLAPESVFLVPE